MAPPPRDTARFRQILDLLRSRHPDVAPSLDHGSPWELLVATVLSAQCSDAQVNRVTPALFARYPDPAALAAADPARVAECIRSIGLFRTKGRNLVAAADRIVREHGGRVPPDRAALESLPGVGRKTASVVLAQGFGIPAFPVDTHVGRVCHRLGFAPSAEPREVERRVTPLVAPDRWNEAHLLLIRHGRVSCAARKPRCGECPVAHLCPWPGRADAPARDPAAAGRRGSTVNR